MFVQKQILVKKSKKIRSFEINFKWLIYNNLYALGIAISSDLGTLIFKIAPSAPTMVAPHSSHSNKHEKLPLLNILRFERLSTPWQNDLNTNFFFFNKQH